MGNTPEPGKSVGWVVGMVALVIAYFGWAFLAAEYFRTTPGVEGETNFWINAFVQLGNLPSVLRYGIEHRLWIIIGTVVLEIGDLVLWVVMKKIEQDWDK